MSDEWAAAPPGWIALDKLPRVVARAVDADNGAVATILRPLIESGALPWRWAGGAGHPRSIRVTPQGIIYGAVDHNGNPPPPDWAALFSGASVMLAEIEVDFAAACAAARSASRVGRLEPRSSSNRSAELELGPRDRAAKLAAAERAREWMQANVTRRGEWKRQAAIIACREQASCTDALAEAAWNALPDLVKGTRGRPRRS